MENTQNRPHFCYTVAAVLIHEDQVLLVKHKKLNIWLNPGGHIEENELPHEAAEREFWEETGIKVSVYDPDNAWWQNEEGYEHIPNSFATNLHWISEANYQLRLAGQLVVGSGCEKHINFMYLVKPTGLVEFKKNHEETTGISWFKESELSDLETHENIRLETIKAFAMSRKYIHAQ